MFNRLTSLYTHYIELMRANGTKIFKNTVNSVLFKSAQLLELMVLEPNEKVK